MKHITKNLFIFTVSLFISVLTVNAQHQMDHPKTDSSKMHHMMNDSTKMHHVEMKDHVCTAECKDSCTMQEHVCTDKCDHSKDMMNHKCTDECKHDAHMMKDDSKAKMMDHKMMKMDGAKESMNMSNKIWNAVCPVKGGEVDPEAPTVQYKGKTIGFCCPGCDSKFQADPEKYMKNLSEDGQSYVGKK